MKYTMLVIYCLLFSIGSYSQHIGKSKTELIKETFNKYDYKIRDVEHHGNVMHIYESNREWVLTFNSYEHCQIAVAYFASWADANILFNQQIAKAVNVKDKVYYDIDYRHFIMLGQELNRPSIIYSAFHPSLGIVDFNYNTPKKRNDLSGRGAH